MASFQVPNYRIEYDEKVTGIPEFEPIPLKGRRAGFNITWYRQLSEMPGVRVPTVTLRVRGKLLEQVDQGPNDLTIFHAHTGEFVQEGHMFSIEASPLLIAAS